MIHRQTAAFALEALDREETEEFERHLTICPTCEEDLAGFRTAAVALAFAIDLPVPPPELRLRVLDAGAPVVPLTRTRGAQLVVAVAALAACAALVVLHPWAGRGEIGGMRTYTAHGAKATLLVGRSGEAVLAVRHLPPAPAGKVYELWVIVEGNASPAGSMTGAVAALTRSVPRGAAVAVSLEPAGGSPRPSGPLLLRAETA